MEVVGRVDVGVADTVRAIEIGRRRDIALGVLPQAARLFEARRELKASIEAGKKSLTGKWYWIIGGAGLVGHYVFARDASFSFGVLVAVLAYAHAMLKTIEVGKLEDRHRQCTERLGELEAMWLGATGYRTFWDLERYVEFGSIEIEGDAFQEFWATQMSWIREGVQSCAS